MNKLTILLGVLCLVFVQARHHGDRSESDRLDDEEPQGLRREDHISQSRHRRRRWQMSSGYDYQPPHYDYRNDRRDYYNNQDLIPQIYKLLDEISTYIRKPQPPPPPPQPPQPIYIPYPVPYFVPKIVVCKTQGSKAPNLTSRFPAMEDTNQNWGFITSNENTDDYDESDGARPINFEPIKPKTQMNRPAPSVEHGSSQFINSVTTQAPFLREERTPNMCNAAVLSCCGVSDQATQKQCFINIGCPINITEKTCSAEEIANALENFKKAYAPVN